jgi:hypothetical protein
VVGEGGALACSSTQLPSGGQLPGAYLHCTLLLSEEYEFVAIKQPPARTQSQSNTVRINSCNSRTGQHDVCVHNAAA